MRNNIFISALAAVSLTFAASSFAQQALTPAASSIEKAQAAEAFNENSTIRGKVKSVDAKRKIITIAGSDGQDYYFPITTRAANLQKVGTEIEIDINCTWPPLRCTVKWRSMS